MPRLSHGGQLSQRHWWLDAGIIPRLVRGAKPQRNLAAPTPASSGDRPPAACDSQSRRGSIFGSAADAMDCRACPSTERRDAPLRFAAGTSFGRSARSRARCFRIGPYGPFFITSGRYSRVDGGVPVGVGVAGVTVAVGVPLRLLHSDPGTCAASAGEDVRVGHRDSSRGSDRQQYTSPMTKGKLCRSTFALDSRRPILL